jgi:hypothetical protein
MGGGHEAGVDVGCPEVEFEGAEGPSRARRGPCQLDPRSQCWGIVLPRDSLRREILYRAGRWLYVPNPPEKGRRQG